MFVSDGLSSSFNLEIRIREIWMICVVKYLLTSCCSMHLCFETPFYKT